MTDIEKFIDNSPSFEDFKNENGNTYWWASDLMVMLGYKEMMSFKKAIDKAMKTCITLGISTYENFEEKKRTVDGQEKPDFKLTRFACYLTVMNADNKKAPVAAAQVYFAEQTRKFELSIQNTQEFDRLLIRDELREGNKSLQSTVHRAGVENYANFVNAGYRGLYNMFNIALAEKRHVKKDQLMEYMGRTELAANLFRITQTEERIKSRKISGQRNLENTHFDVGREVRNIVISNTGYNPEDLLVEQKLPEVQRQLKKGYKNMLKDDNHSQKNKKSSDG